MEHAAADYLKAYAIDTLLVSFLFCFIGYFNGCGKTAFVMTQGFVGVFLAQIPVSWFMSGRADTQSISDRSGYAFRYCDTDHTLCGMFFGFIEKTIGWKSCKSNQAVGK